MKNKKKIIIGVISIVFVITIGLFIFLRKDNSLVSNNKTKKKIDIDKVLKSKSYDYLPVQAKSYVKEVYEKTGNVILTEKNKKKNQSYLNPAYVQYLVDKDTKTITSEPFEDTEENKDKAYYGIVPMEMTIDMDFSKVSASSSDFPSKYDLRNVDGKRYIAPERNHSVGNNYAATYGGALESKILKTYSNINYKDLHFSEGHANYAMKNSINVSGFDTPYSVNDRILQLDYNAGGGNIVTYSNSLNKGISPIENKLWKYTDDYNGKVNPEDVWNFDNVDYEVDGLNIYTYPTDEDKDDFIKMLKQKIMDNGSVAVHVNIYDFAKDKDGNYVIFQDGSVSKDTNHGVQIIGWDDSYNYTLCYNSNNDKKPTKMLSNSSQSCDSDEKKISGSGTWIIKNSTSDDSYGYLPYDSYSDTYVSFIDVHKKDNTWDNIYNYDLAKKNYSIEKINGTEYDITTYKFETLGKEKLYKIKFNLLIYDDFTQYFFIKRKDDSDYIPLGSQKVDGYGMYSVSLPDNLDIEGEFEIALGTNEENTSILTDGLQNIDLYIYTKNADNDKKISLEEASVTTDSNIRNNLGISDQEEMISVKGVSRNLKTSDKIEYKMYKLNNITEPEIVELEKNGIKIYRNYSVSNVINTIITYNKEKPLDGSYIITASHGEAQDKINITLGNIVKPVSGSGTEGDPYIIKNQYQLDNIRNNPCKSYRLGNNIKFKEHDYEKGGAFYNDGEYFKPINVSYCNTKTKRLRLDGAGYKIENLRIKRTTEGVGLFGDIYESDFTIMNLTIDDAEIVGSGAGALIGAVDFKSNSLIDNVHVTNSQIEGNTSAGGLIGNLRFEKGYDSMELGIANSFIKNITIDRDSKVVGNSLVGGIIGSLYQTMYTIYFETHDISKYQAISDVSSYASVTAKGSDGYAAGIVPYIYSYIGSYKSYSTSNRILVFNNVDSYGTIQGAKCHAQILCVAKEYIDGSVVNNKVIFNNVKYLGANGGDAYLKGQAIVEGEANSYERPPAEDQSNTNLNKPEEEKGTLKNAVEKVVKKIVDWALTPLRKILNFLKS